MRKVFGAFFAGVLLMFSCTGRQAQRVEEPTTDSVADTVDSVPLDTLEQLLVETPTPKAMDEFFDDFLFNFAANKKVQKARIIFPLTVHKDGKDEQIDKNKWQMERFFMRQGGESQRERHHHSQCCLRDAGQGYHRVLDA